MLPHRRYGSLRRCGLHCRRGKALRLRPCRYLIRRQFLRRRQFRLIRFRRVFLRPLPRRLMRPWRTRRPRRPQHLRLHFRYLFLRVRFREAPRFPRSPCLRRAPVRFYRDRVSLFRPVWATLRKLLPGWLVLAWLVLAWLLLVPRGQPPQACRAFPRLRARKLCGRVRLQRRPMRLIHCVHRQSRI
jgi:hypothetical protein